ncbi:MAG: tetratricopeptide repeat protein, partial [Thermosynechococcaceae cyanobacterium]
GNASSSDSAVVVAPEARSLELHSEGIRSALQGDYPEAIAKYDQALMLSPQNPEIYYNRAVAHYSEHHDQLAVQDFNRAIQLQPTMAEAYANRSMIHLDMGDPARALADGQKAVTLFDQQGEKEQAAEVRAWLQEQAIQEIR